MFRNTAFLMMIVSLPGLAACSSIRRTATNAEGRTFSPAARAAARGGDTSEMPAIDEAIEPGRPLSLSDAISAVLSHNPELRAYAWDLRVAEARRRQAGFLPNPELELGAEDFLGQNDREGFDGAEASVSLTQPIELGGKRGRRSRVALRELDLVSQNHASAKLDLIRQTRQAFAEVLGAQRKVELTAEHARLAEALLDTVAKRVEAGRDSAADMAKANIVLSQARLEQRRGESDLADSRSRLAMLWGGERAEFGSVVPPPDRPAEPPALPELMQNIERHPKILLRQEKIALAEARLDMERSQSLPNLGLTAGLKRSALENDTTGILALSLPLPIFDRNQGMIAAAKHELASAREQQAMALAEARAGLTSAHQRLQTAMESAAMISDSVLADARTVYEITRKGYEEGKFDYLQLLEAQRLLCDAQSQELDARIAAHTAWNELDYAIGKIVKD